MKRKQTTVLFLRCYRSRVAYEQALDWIRAHAYSRVYCLDTGLWVLDIEQAPGDPEFEARLEAVRANGWEVVGSTLWDAAVPIRSDQQTIKTIYGLTVGNAGHPAKRNQKS